MAFPSIQTLLYLPNVFLGLQLVYSGFSRFTGGRYTLAYYAWQRAHQSPEAQESNSILVDSFIIPSVDVAIALTLLFARPPTAFKVAIVASAFLAFGAYSMANLGQDWSWDLILLISGVFAAIGSRLRRM
ncbi:hypothetical protein GQ53DRAFT_743167 [Thozetella sp. PMI_491]|nr:hypothetical protein GQ53DRAFT_743167 [Thozetella sp. PMI_491]